eukprot:GSChrysophyteH1.ASY1.ANO1.390.1 assembled CDS
MKKLTIKPFKSKPKLPEDFESKTWAKLQGAVKSVYMKSTVKESKEELYRAVEDMCMHKLGEALYNRLKVECATFIYENQVWRDHCDHMNTLRNIFLYLDRSYALETVGVHSIWDVGLLLFRNRLESRADVETMLIVGLLATIESDRIGQTFEEDAVRRLLRMLSALGLDPAGFLIHIERRMAEAVEMTNRYLHPSTKGPLLKRIEDTLLKPHVETIVDKGLGPLLEGNRVVDLRRMYLLLDRVGAVGLVKAGWVDFVRHCGETLVKDASKEKTFVEDFEFFLNITPGRTAELLAKFVDRKLRGERGTSEDEAERALDRSLSKRLLYAKSASSDLEQVMITKLKTECGANYTAKLEGIGCKVELSMRVLTVGNWSIDVSDDVAKLRLPAAMKDLQSSFSTYYLDKYSGRRLVWAHHVERCLVSARFSKGKKELEVSLLQTLCLMCFNPKSKGTGTSADSAEPLVRVPFIALKELTGIESSELRRTLQSLACGPIGTRVLTKEPKGKEVDDSDTFVSNKEFTNKLFRIKFNSIQLRESAEENDRTHEEVFRDRMYTVDAVIVRILKARKRITHTNLIGELLQQLRWPAKPTELKKRIESLIEREYLDRDSDDPQVYNYLA